MYIFGPYKQGVLLLVFGPPYFEHGKCGVAEEDFSNLYPAAGRINDLLHNIAVAARALVMDTHYRVGIAQFNTGAQDPVHLLFHLRVSTLDSIKVEFRNVLALYHA